MSLKPSIRKTRQSVSKQSTPTNSPLKKRNSNKVVDISPIQTRRRSIAVMVSQKKTVKSRSSSERDSPKKITREVARKLREELLSRVKFKKTSEDSASTAGRPSRRTKEAATLNMTLIGHEERDSSDQEETSPIGETQKKVTTPVITGRKRPIVSPVGVMTRRAAHSASPTVKKRMILRQAARRFSAVAQSSSSDESKSSCSSSSSNASSSDEKDSTPVSSVRTRSSLTRNSTTKISEELRETRSTLKKKVVETSSNSTVKSFEKTPKVNVTNKRVGSRPTVVTPTLNSDLEDSLIEAPVFHPSEKEFTDPIEYLQKIWPECEKFGICRIVPPPSFKPECQVSDAMRFTANNQYVHRMFRRKGINSRHFNAIERHLSGLDIDCHPAPCIGGIEVDLYGLYQAVQDLGGPKKVLENNLWPKVADLLRV